MFRSRIPKASKPFLEFKELFLGILIILLILAFYIPHILDPSFRTDQWLFAYANHQPLPSFHPRFSHLQIATHNMLILSRFLGVILLLSISYILWRFIWRQHQRKIMKTYRILLSRDDLATPLKVGAFFDTAAKTLSTRYVRIILGNSPMNLAFYRQPDGELVILLRVADKYLRNITSSLQATWTSVRIEPYAGSIIFPKAPVMAVVRPRKRTDLYAFRSYRDYTDSVTEDLLNQMDNFSEPAILDIALKPLPINYSDKVTDIQRKHQRNLNALSYVDNADPTLSMGDQAQLQGVVKQAGRSWWRVDIRIATSGISQLQGLHGALSSSDAENNWQYHRVWFRKQWMLNLMKTGMPSFQPLAKRFFLNGTFLATLWQIPSARLRAKGLTRSSTRRGPGTVGLTRNESGCTPVADEHGPVIVPEGDRKQGILVNGQQGTGKSTILEQVAWNDFQQDKATIVIDPKFKMADRLRGLIPNGRKVAIWQVGNLDIPWGWNPFLQSDISHHLIVAGVLDGMKQVWGKDGIGPRSTDYLRYAMAATLATAQGNRGFLSVEEILRQPHLWGALSQRLPSPINDWFRAKAEEYDNNAKIVAEGTDAPLNKLSDLNFSENMRHSLSTSVSLDIRKVIRDKGILIVSLEADQIGNEAANLIGTFLVAATWEALKRAGRISPATTSLIIDEAHRMVCPSFANMLAEGRSYGAQASVGLQFVGQIGDPIVAASISELLQHIFLFRSNQVEETESYMKLLSRVYTNMIGPDAEIQDKLAFGPDDRFNLPNYQALCRIVVGGQPKPAFLGTTIPLTPDAEVANKHPWGECPEEWLIRTVPSVSSNSNARNIITINSEQKASLSQPNNSKHDNKLSGPQEGVAATENLTGKTEKIPDENLFEKAISIIRETNSASAALFQRRLRIGYTKAAQLIDELEQHGCVGPFSGGKPREIFLDKTSWSTADLVDCPEAVKPEGTESTEDCSVTVPEPNVTEQPNTNVLAPLGITDKQIEYIQSLFGDAVVGLAIKRVQLKAKREVIEDPYQYLLNRCQDIKKNAKGS